MRQPAWEPVDASVTIVGRVEAGARVRDESQHAGDRVVLDARHRRARAARRRREGNAADYDRASVAGKVVLADGGVGRVFPEAVQKRGALGVLTYNMPAYTQPETHRTRFSLVRSRTTRVKKSWGMPLSRDAVDQLRAALAKGPGDGARAHEVEDVSVRRADARGRSARQRLRPTSGTC